MPTLDEKMVVKREDGYAFRVPLNEEQFFQLVSQLAELEPSAQIRAEMYVRVLVSMDSILSGEEKDRINAARIAKNLAKFDEPAALATGAAVAMALSLDDDDMEDILEAYDTTAVHAAPDTLQ